MKWHEMLAKHEMEEQDRRSTLLDKMDAGIPLDADDRAQQATRNTSCNKAKG